MPKGKTKKFIDKKNSVTFHLVHRSQQDPLAADETAPQRVLVPVGSHQSSKSSKKSENTEKRKEEQQKYGIFFDDDYDYLQHLKDVNKISVDWSLVENPNSEKDDKKLKKINLPSSVFASNVEEEIGLLNKAAPITGPRLDFDPEIVAAMDDDFDYDDPDNELEDNFIELANANISQIDENDENNYETDESDILSDNMNLTDEENDEICSLNDKQFTFKDEETKSRFTDYSISSSVIRRNKQLSLLDDKFERMFSSYDENEIGPLDCEEIEGYVTSDSNILLKYADDFEKQKNELTDNFSELMKEKLKFIEINESDDDYDDIEKITVKPREKEKWDCESVLSTYSNIYNHPKLISEPKGFGKIKLGKGGIPKDILDEKSGKLTAKSLAQFDKQNDIKQNKLTGPISIAETMKSTLSILSVRPKDETLEDKKERKKAIKEYRRERRLERKANSDAFKEEKKRQEKIMLNNKQNIQGNRIL